MRGACLLVLFFLMGMPALFKAEDVIGQSNKTKGKLNQEKFEAIIGHFPVGSLLGTLNIG